MSAINGVENKLVVAISWGQSFRVPFSDIMYGIGKDWNPITIASRIIHG